MRRDPVRRRRTRWILAPLLVLTGGCSIVFGFDGFTGNVASGSDGGAASNDGGVLPVTKCGNGAAHGTCVPPRPPNWNGPVFIYEGQVDAGAPPCPRSEPPVAVGLTHPRADDVTCSPCSCETSAPGCAAPKVLGAAASGCATDGGVSAPPNTCVVLSSLSAIIAYRGRMTESLPTAKCTPSAASIVKAPDVSWAASGQACSAAALSDPTAACPSGQSCVEDAPAGFIGGKYCVYAWDKSECPADSVYTELHQFSTDGTFKDNRGCAPCDCDVTGGKCDSSGLRLQLYSDFMCAAATGDELTVQSACTDLTAPAFSGRLLGGEPDLTSPPSCTPRGDAGGPTGSVSGAGWAVCCTP